MVLKNLKIVVGDKIIQRGYLVFENGFFTTSTIFVIASFKDAFLAFFLFLDLFFCYCFLFIYRIIYF